MAAHRKAWTRVLEDTLVTSSCRAALSGTEDSLAGRGQSTEARAQSQLAEAVLPRQRK